MRFVPRLALLALLPALAAGVLLAQFGGFGRRFEEPTDANKHTEWAFARLVYPGTTGGGGFYGRRGRWAADMPEADWHFAAGVQRLTRINGRSANQLVRIDSDAIFNWPWIYAAQVGSWNLSADEAHRLREYLLRGGFLFVDNFHGTADWERFLVGIRKVFPNRPVVDLPDDDPIFHTLYNVGHNRPQIPGAQYEWTHLTYVDVPGGKVPRWAAIRDDRGRIMVAICFNMHLGDAWEHADDPRYPEHFTSDAYRIGIDYLIYAMSH